MRVYAYIPHTSRRARCGVFAALRTEEDRRGAAGRRLAPVARNATPRRPGDHSEPTRRTHSGVTGPPRGAPARREPNYSRRRNGGRTGPGGKGSQRRLSANDAANR